MAEEFKVSRQSEKSPYEIRDVKWSLHYQAIGEFVAEFEKITTALRFGYGCILQARGLKDWTLSHYILHIPTIGPEHLAICLSAAVRSLFPEDKGLIVEADRVLKETKAIAEK